MHIYYKLLEALAPVLQKANMKMVAECLQPEVFSSAYADFTNGRDDLRVIWNGKDAQGCVQYRGPQDDIDWNWVQVFVSRQDLEAEPPTAQVNKMLLAVQQAIGGGSE